MKIVEYLRGITPEEARRLRGFGVVHAADLLHACTYVVDRQRVARKTGIPEPRLLALAHQAALLEVSGLDDRYQTVLRRLGIVTMGSLADEEAEDLRQRMVQAMGLAAAPTLGMVQYWISQARVIDVIEQEEEPIEDLPPELTNLSAEAVRSEI